MCHGLLRTQEGVLNTSGALTIFPLLKDIEMIIHTFAFHWKPEANEAQKRQAMEEIGALKAQIPEVLEAHVGLNFSSHGRGYALAGMMKFADRQRLQAYADHAAHQRLLAWLLPLVELIEIDFES